MIESNGRAPKSDLVQAYLRCLTAISRHVCVEKWQESVENLQEPSSEKASSKKLAPENAKLANLFLTTLIPVQESFFARPLAMVTESEHETSTFCQLFVVLSSFASVDSGQGHTLLVKAVISWLGKCRDYLGKEEVLGE